MKNSVQKYFDSVAIFYKNSHIFPFNYLRKKELESFNEALKKVEIIKKDVLEIGSGIGFYTKILINQCEKPLTVCDISSKMLAQLQENHITKICGDFCYIKLNSQFDVVSAISVFEFISNRNIFFTKITECLKKNGFLILSVIRPNIFGKIYYLYHRQHNLKILISPLDLKDLEKNFNLKLIFQKKSHLFSQMLVFVCQN